MYSCNVFTPIISNATKVFNPFQYITHYKLLEVNLKMWDGSYLFLID